MSQTFDKDKALEVYTRLMELAQAGAYQERNPDGSYAEDGVEESLEQLDLTVVMLGLCFRWNDKAVCWTLEPLSEQEKAAFTDALHDFAEHEKRPYSRDDFPVGCVTSAPSSSQGALNIHRQTAIYRLCARLKQA